jgi:electron transfer flavoprotein beta subunit
MNTIVIMKLVPDTVEELEIDDSEKNLDKTYLSLIPSELDEHALEQALLLKEKFGGTVTVLALDFPGTDDMLFSALAKGVDKAIKVTHSFGMVNTKLMAGICQGILSQMQSNLILTGAQAIDDVDGELAAMLSGRLNLPYVSVAVKVQPDPASNQVEIVKELGGGLMSSYLSPLPAIVGIQSAEQPPRYVPLMKVRNAKQTMSIEAVPAPALESQDKIDVLKLYKPEVASAATMLTGSTEEITSQLINMFKEKGVV